MQKGGIKTSLLLGWATKLEAKRKADANKINQIMRKQVENDLAYAIQYDGDGHLVTFAPTGSGKGVSVIIPNLLHYLGPTIVIDPKGENFAVTAKYRKSLGQKIYLLDPFHAIPDQILSEYDVQREKLNPLDLCLFSESGIENDAQMLASLFSGDGTLGKDPFWDISALKLLSGVIAHEMEVSKEQYRRPKFGRLIELLFSADTNYTLTVLLETSKPSEFVKRTVGSFLEITDVTRSGILTTTQSYFATIMTGDLIANSLEESTISLRDIQEREDYTLFIVIPPNKLKSHSVLLKVWVATLMHSVMERKKLPDLRTLFVLDECANLGEMDVLRKAVTLLRGYGLQVWMFFQDLSQMEALYKSDFKTMINNCGVLQAFGISRLSVANPLATIIGEYKDSDILSLDQTQQILSIAPGKVRVARLLKYYKDNAFSGRYSQNPLINNRRVPVKNNRRLLIRNRSKIRFG